MCFLNEYDWYADIHDVSQVKSDGKHRCMECSATIPEGVTCQKTYQRQHEYCDDCGWVYGVDSDDCEHDFGEESEWYTCEVCAAFLEAVKASELEAGCRESESLPLVGGMFAEIDRESARRYTKKAVAMFPQHRLAFGKLYGSFAEIL
jgi:hypothetical protein